MQSAPFGEGILISSPLCLIKAEGNVNGDVGALYNKGVGFGIKGCTVNGDVCLVARVGGERQGHHSAGGKVTALVCCNNTVCGLVYGNLVFGLVDNVKIVFKSTVNSVAVFIVKAVARRERDIWLCAYKVINRNTRGVCVVGEVKHTG